MRNFTGKDTYLKCLLITKGAVILKTSGNASEIQRML